MWKVISDIKADEIEKKVFSALEMYGDTESKRLEAYAKLNAPWKNRTGNARNSIQGSFQRDGKKLTIIVSGNTDYFPALELAHEKKYAILKPTVDKFASPVFEGYKKVIK